MHSIIERLDVLEDARTCLMLIPKVALVHQLILPFREEVLVTALFRQFPLRRMGDAVAVQY